MILGIEAIASGAKQNLSRPTIKISLKKSQNRLRLDENG